MSAIKISTLQMWLTICIIWSPLLPGLKVNGVLISQPQHEVAATMKNSLVTQMLIEADVKIVGPFWMLDKDTIDKMRQRRGPERKVVDEDKDHVYHADKSFCLV